MKRVNPGLAHTYSVESLACAGALQCDLLASSIDFGWRSCILNHVEGHRSAEILEHATPDLTIVVATQGEHDLEVLDKGRWRHSIYEVGATGLIPSGQATRLNWRNRRTDLSFRTAHLHMPTIVLDEAAELLRKPGQSLSTNVHSTYVANDRVTPAVVASLLEAMSNGAPDIYAETALRWLAVDLIKRAHKDVAQGDRSPGNMTDKRLARAVEFITANFHRPISLDDMAREAGISPFHFTRLFRQSIGLSPHAFLIERRLKKALALLKSKVIAVCVIGAECGYPLATSFTTAFTRRFGMPPSSVARRRSQLTTT